MTVVRSFVAMGLVFLSSQSFAFEANKVSALVTAMENFAASGCSNDYVSEMKAAIDSMSYPLDNSFTREQADEINALRDALAGARAATVDALFGAAPSIDAGSSCQQNMATSIAAVQQLQN